jgi:hypothetical protein
MKMIYPSLMGEGWPKAGERSSILTSSPCPLLPKEKGEKNIKILEIQMSLFVLGSLSLCLLFFLVMACVNLINIERKVLEAVRLTEAKVSKLYEG